MRSGLHDALRYERMPTRRVTVIQLPSGKVVGEVSDYELRRELGEATVRAKGASAVVHTGEWWWVDHKWEVQELQANARAADEAHARLNPGGETATRLAIERYHEATRGQTRWARGGPVTRSPWW